MISSGMVQAGLKMPSASVHAYAACLLRNCLLDLILLYTVIMARLGLWHSSWSHSQGSSDQLRGDA